MSNRVIIEKFPHSEGSHCESTPLRDITNFIGYPYNESMLFGLDATMGFAFWDPEKYSAIFENNNGPAMIIGGKSSGFNENSLACKVLGIELEKKTFTNKESAWKDAIESINSGNPLMIQVDMAYLTYFGFPDIHFGGHFISLIGYDLEKNVAIVCDNDSDTPHELSIEDLKLARCSDFGPKFMRPYNTRYILKKRADNKHPPIMAGIKLSIQKVVNNMLAASLSNNGIFGLDKFRDWIKNFEKNLPTDRNNKLSIFEGLWGYIEDYGTGGGLFRKLYCDFLRQIPDLNNSNNEKYKWKQDEIELLNSSIPLLEESASKWTNLSEYMKDYYENEKSKLGYDIEYHILGDLVDDIYDLEKKFFNEMKSIKI